MEKEYRTQVWRDDQLYSTVLPCINTNTPPMTLTIDTIKFTVWSMKTGMR